MGLSSVGMFGTGGGWGIPIAPPTLMITVGGIATNVVMSMAISSHASCWRIPSTSQIPGAERRAGR